MNKILYIMIFALGFNVYASDAGGSHSGSRDSEIGEVLIPIDIKREMAGPDGSTIVLFESADNNEGEEGEEMPPAMDVASSSNAPTTPARPGSMVISEPQQSQYPDLNQVVALIKQIPLEGLLMYINGMAFVNRTHNPITVIVPYPNDPRLAAVFTVMGTKAHKDGGSQKIGLPIPVISADAQKYTADKAFNTFWGIIKWHTGERYIVHYGITGVHSYKLSPDGKFTHKNLLALASDKVRDMILFADHDTPGVKLIFEDQLPMLRPVSRKSVTSTPKAITAKPRK